MSSVKFQPDLCAKVMENFTFCLFCTQENRDRHLNYVYLSHIMVPIGLTNVLFKDRKHLIKDPVHMYIYMDVHSYVFNLYVNSSFIFTTNARSYKMLNS